MKAKTFRKAASSKLPVILMMIDIDHFKAINDGYGHVVGDRVICRVAATIAGAKREGDQLFRYGGEEFALLCQEPAANAEVLAERIRSAVAGSQDPALGQPVTISIGIATFPRHADRFADLLARANAALYEAKLRGRNMVVSAGMADMPNLA